ncbi:MAG: hypothetical protein ACD_5C00253G0004 [uncultured bacterium]|nr:MAG: hypothetical protein ACD_5C00253G0004 [uncultured bacterium]
MTLYNSKNRNGLMVKRSSAGLGLFANKKIIQGTFITEYTGDLITTEEADKRGGKYLFRIDPKWVVDGKNRTNLARYINHCCRPNCEVIINRKMILIYALKDIMKGEEINYDYGKEYFLTYIKPHGCLCPYCKANGFLK